MKLTTAVFLFVVTLMASATIRAESVYVKYFGNVSLDPFICSYPNSSFVNRICYRSEKSYLVVLLNNTNYHYCRLPPEILENWLSAQSAGRFYNTFIKGNFDCRLGGIPSD
ncbi:KTSC domain-containing protein [Marinobacter sp. F3R08]|uniref:KTSC domain-containing protein n=1 Tax=Marinobacter sp. F3R08 TaxID=2841559 RepID=UPI001C0862A7|nr:KTSC domain-containing protein [Marinobacter sp. F3R08]